MAAIIPNACAPQAPPAPARKRQDRDLITAPCQRPGSRAASRLDISEYAIDVVARWVTMLAVVLAVASKGLIATVSVLINPKNVIVSLSLSATREAAATLGIRLTPVTATTPDELRALGPTDLAGSGML
jgi:hypothetical protein